MRRAPSCENRGRSCSSPVTNWVTSPWGSPGRKPSWSERCSARAAAAVWFSTPSLVQMCSTCFSTVRALMLASLPISERVARIALRLLLRRRGPHEHPEEAVLLVIGARGEEEGIRRPVVGGALAEAERPESVDGDRRPFGGVKRAAVLELAVAFQAAEVEGVNAPVAKVADEQVVAERPEIGGCQRQPPGRVEFAFGRDAADQVAAGVEGV